MYLYALVDSPAPVLAGVTGLAGARLGVLERGPVAAVCSDHETLQLDAGAATLWEHERVTSALLDGGRAVAPARFGTVVAGRHALSALLDARGGEFAEMLGRLRGGVELSLRAAWEAPDAAATSPAGGHGPGQTYLRSLVPPPAAADLHATLSGQARAATLKPAGASMSAAYLVETARVASFRRTVARWRHTAPGLRVWLTGPWAPFSFVGEVSGGR